MVPARLRVWGFRASQPSGHSIGLLITDVPTSMVGQTKGAAGIDFPQGLLGIILVGDGGVSRNKSLLMGLAHT